MDSALKQRLLGAAVLIALAIIFVPMFLGNAPPKQDSTTVNLDIPPPPERKFETRTLPVETPSAPATPAPADSNKIVTVDTRAPARTDARPEDVATAPTAKPEAKPSVLADAKTPAPVAAPPVAVAPAATAGRFAVNLGIYADQAHADALVAKMKKLGQPAYSETTDYQGKPALRVRVGPFADRAAAETVRLKIKQVEPKVPSSVVESAEQPRADAPASALPPNRAGGWAVQLGAFKTEAEANKLRDRLRGGGVASFVDRTGTDQPLWRVRAGPYADRGSADSARGGIKQKFQIDGMIVTQP
ncbi:MAG: SPOR domain-containing protein [Rudaea sp.]|nr:SPOR domain-containing protein [Rudaea sp.]